MSGRIEDLHIVTDICPVPESRFKSEPLGTGPPRFLGKPGNINNDDFRLAPRSKVKVSMSVIALSAVV